MTGICCDLDGVVWRGGQVLPGADRAIAALRQAGRTVLFVTNNTGSTLEDLMQRLEKCGIPVAASDLLTSAQVTTQYVVKTLGSHARVLLVAGDGARQSLTQAGITLVEEGPCEAVVAGINREFNYDLLDRSSAAIRNGAAFIASNRDPVFPDHGTLRPGSGSIVAAIQTASQTEPIVIGKPEEPIAQAVRTILGDDAILIGDQPSVDGALAQRLGWPFALVLTGVAQRNPGVGEEPIPNPPPSFVGDDLSAVVDQILASS